MAEHWLPSLFNWSRGSMIWRLSRGLVLFVGLFAAGVAQVISGHAQSVPNACVLSHVPWFLALCRIANSRPFSTSENAVFGPGLVQDAQGKEREVIPRGVREALRAMGAPAMIAMPFGMGSETHPLLPGLQRSGALGAHPAARVRPAAAGRDLVVPLGVPPGRMGARCGRVPDQARTVLEQSVDPPTTRVRA